MPLNQEERAEEQVRLLDSNRVSKETPSLSTMSLVKQVRNRKKMHMKKPNEKMVSEQRSERESAFTPGSFFGTDGEYFIHR